jgi:aminoglycoside phosphotransferase (APT) family kinase protein
MGATDDLAGDLGRLLGGAVSELRRLSGGASRETWSFRLDDRPLILQRQRPGSDLARSMRDETAAVRAAGAAGLPVPAIVLDATGDDLPLGLPAVVVEHVPGESIARKLLRDDDFASVRPGLAEECGKILAGIHRLPPGVVETDPVVDPLPGLQGTMDSFGTAHPAFELAFRWLARHRPPASPRTPTLVHGDFRTGNLLVTPAGVTAVLDWEIVHSGDPLEDLGWFCVRAWRFGVDVNPAGGFGSREQLWAGYEAGGGGVVDPDAARWWEVYGTLRWGVICLMQASAHRLGFSRSVELATIGWRACENEYDVLALLAPDRDPPPATPVGLVGDVPGVGPHAAELVEAVREWVEGDVAEATDGRVRFHARVATNALAMIERAIRIGPTLDAAHAERLARLGVADDHALAAAIRRGDFDNRWDEVVGELWSASRDALAISHPGYDESRP